MAYTALIIGGGIAGTLSAIALRKAGIDAVVYEAYQGTADNVGAFLTLPVNALDVLRTLDIDLGELGFDTGRMTISSGSGRRLGEIPYGPALPDGTVSRTIKRAALYQALREQAALHGVPIRYGKRLVDADRTVEGVRARFADGSTAEGDLLIGADGLWSRTREIVDPNTPRPRFTGLINTGGYAHGVSLDSEPEVMHAIFGKRCFFVYTIHPAGEVWWMANPARATELAPQEASTISPHAWRAWLLDLFRRDRGPALDLIEATENIFAGWNTYDLPAVARWHRDRMIIIGDAAHATAPSIGQGGAMAIEDTIVLAMCLRDMPDIEVAFATYETLRRQRVERVVKQGQRTGGWKAVGPLARIPRDLILTLGMKQMARNGKDPSAWIYDYRIDWQNSITRPHLPLVENATGRKP